MCDLGIRDGNKRDVVRIFWYISAMERINPLTFAYILNDPVLPQLKIANASRNLAPPSFFCGRLRLDPKLSVRVRKCVCVWLGNNITYRVQIAPKEIDNCYNLEVKDKVCFL